MSRIKTGMLMLLRGLDLAISKLPHLGRFQPLRGSFSAFTALQQGNLTGALILSAQPSGPYPDGSITARCGMSQHDYQPWPIFWTLHPKAHLTGPRGFLRNHAHEICSEAIYHAYERRRICASERSAQTWLPKPTFLAGPWVSLASNWMDGRNYYHWMCDGLTRLALLDHLPEPAQILLPPNPPRFVTETIELLGLSHRTHYQALDHCIAERFYFCSPTAMTGAWNPFGYSWLQQQFGSLKNATPNGKPVFFTRRGVTRLPQHLQEIETRFADAGFLILDCGTLTVKEQMFLSSSAPAIAGIHGAAMTNLLWAHPHTPALELFSPTFLNGCYEQIAFHGKLSYTALILDDGCQLDLLESEISKLSSSVSR